MYLFRSMGQSPTKFVGARKELPQLFQSEIFKNRLGHKNIMWKFIAPLARNFGDTCDAGIKSLNQ